MRVVVIGGGFTGLAAAYELAGAGAEVTLVEATEALGGLAGTFDFGGEPLEKFYHHWFTSDTQIDMLVAELGLSDRIVTHPTRTGTYYANTVFRLSRPLDVLRYSALPFLHRVRLGMLVVAARRIRDWRELDGRTAQDWLRSVAGRTVYETVWRPLLQGKFGAYAERISAVWIWNKLVLRGGSRGRGGRETLRYFSKGFGALASAIGSGIERRGGTIRLNAPVTSLIYEAGRVRGVEIAGERLGADAVLATIPLPQFAELVMPFDPAYAAELSRIEYLGNICLVLALDRSLSDYYWVNVADPDFPFVGIIEHTNFEPPERYAGRHIVYISKYLETSSTLYTMSDAEYFEFALPYVRRIFPSFDRSWVADYKIHRARYAQPVVVPGYPALIPRVRTPIDGLWLATMAQVFPEDRGTNYAVRDGREAARLILDEAARA